MRDKIALNQMRKQQLDEIAAIIVHTITISKASQSAELMLSAQFRQNYSKALSFFLKLLQNEFDVFHTSTLQSDVR